MKIAESSVTLAGEHRLEESRESSDTMKVLVSGGWKGFGEVFNDRVRNNADQAAPVVGPSEVVQVRCGQGKEVEALILQLLLSLLDAVKKGAGLEGAEGVWPQCLRRSSRAPLTEQPVEPLQVEVSYQHQERVTEQECTSFSACGRVCTADGCQVDFTLALHMDRRSEHEETVAAGGRVYQLKDPLVINFDGKAAELTGARFGFDLTGNGKTEDIPFVGTGSGFLALDRDGNGKVDDGRELFGALSGDGFADLAALDSDRDGWLDEGDAAFGSLLVWSRDLAGKDSLESLKDKGVGALYLGKANTEFSLEEGGGRLQGKVRSSGIYLTEDGAVGTVQQVDLAV